MMHLCIMLYTYTGCLSSGSEWVYFPNSVFKFRSRPRLHALAQRAHSFALTAEDEFKTTALCMKYTFQTPTQYLRLPLRLRLKLLIVCRSSVGGVQSLFGLYCYLITASDRVSRFPRPLS